MTPYSVQYINTPIRNKGRVGFKQLPPYILVSPMKVWDYPCVNGNPAMSWGISTPFNRYPSSTSFEASVANKAYARFTAEFGDSSQFGATLSAELKKTLGSVTGTVIRLASAARSIKRLRFGDAAKTLGLPYRERTIRRTFPSGRNRKKRKTRRIRVFRLPDGREVQKTLANGWLFYSYGVKPLAGDIYNGMDVLQRPIPGKHIRVSARDKFTTTERSYFSFSGGGYSQVVYSGQVKIILGALIEVTNPNLWLLNQMGLINPVQWANEAIPFSFVIDWFSNLSQVIMHVTDFAGLTVSRPYTCIKRTQSQANALVYYNINKSGYFSEVNSSAFERAASLPTPELVFRYERFQVARGLNAISLLVGLLPNSRR
jgi:hypothetical protein